MTATAPLTGQAVVEAWRRAWLRVGWVVDRDLRPQVFDDLAQRIDAVILDAMTRPPHIARDPIPEDGKRGGKTTSR